MEPKVSSQSLPKLDSLLEEADSPASESNVNPTDADFIQQSLPDVSDEYSSSISYEASSSQSSYPSCFREDKVARWVRGTLFDEQVGFPIVLKDLEVDFSGEEVASIGTLPVLLFYSDVPVLIKPPDFHRKTEFRTHALFQGQIRL